MKHPPVKFEISKKEAEKGYVGAVRVTLAHGGVINFSAYFRTVIMESKLAHPTGKMHHASVQSMRAKFRVDRGIWTTFGVLEVRLFSVRRQQVRANLWFNADRSALTDRHNLTQVSWHLSESAVILPALVQSIATMDHNPLRNTGLFSETLPDTPETRTSVWTTVGNEAK